MESMMDKIRRPLVCHHLHEAARYADKAAACADHMKDYYGEHAAIHLNKACNEMGLVIVGTMELLQATRIVEKVDG